MERTPTKQKKHYKRISRVCFASEFLSVVTPFVAMGIANYNEWFIEYDGTKMSLAFFLSMAVMGLAVYLVSKKKFENSFVTLIIGWAVVTGILFLLGKIINDLAYIMLFGLFGILGAYGLDIGSKQADKKAKEIQSGIDKAKQDMTAEAYKAELSEKKVKVKVKK